MASVTSISLILSDFLKMFILHTVHQYDNPMLIQEGKLNHKNIKILLYVTEALSNGQGLHKPFLLCNTARN